VVVIWLACAVRAETTTDSEAAPPRTRKVGPTVISDCTASILVETSELLL